MAIGDNQNISASLKLQKSAALASLILGAIPSGMIFVNGESRSVTGASTTTFALSPGTYSVVFRHPEYGSRTTSLKIESGQSTTLVCHFVTRVSIVSNSETGSPIPSLILVNGRSLGNEAPGVIRLGPGKYKIGVAKTGYQVNEPEKEITLVPSLDGQKEIEVVFTLKKL